MTSDQANQIVNLLTEIKAELVALNEKIGNYNQPMPVAVVGQVQVEVDGVVETFSRR